MKLRWGKEPQRKKIKCPICNSTKHKIVFTHGYKSRGYKICKRCGAIIKIKMLKKKDDKTKN